MGCGLNCDKSWLDWCPKLLSLENPFEFIWNLKSSFGIWKFNFNLKKYYPVWKIGLPKVSLPRLMTLSIKTSISWKSVWIYLKSQIEFWNLKIWFKSEKKNILSENLFQTWASRSGSVCMYSTLSRDKLENTHMAPDWASDYIKCQNWYKISRLNNIIIFLEIHVTICLTLTR